jgi:hypothetical protein
MRKQSTENAATHVNQPNPKTAPPGMAPDHAHALRNKGDFTRETEREETFDSSPSNAGSKQSGHVNKP